MRPRPVSGGNTSLILPAPMSGMEPSRAVEGDASAPAPVHVLAPGDSGCLVAPSRPPTSESAEDFLAARIRHWDGVAPTIGKRRRWGRAYHARLEEVYRVLVPPGRRVLELGCGTGDLLAAVRPSVGVGVDVSPAMLRQAGAKHPGLRLVLADAHSLPLDEEFDTVILSDLINEVWDVQRVFEQVRRVCHPRTRVLINTYSRLWDLPLRAVRGLGLARPVLEQNWLTVGDTYNLLELSGLEPLRSWQEVLWPLGTPLLGRLCNRYLARLPLLNHLALSNFIVARPAPAALRARRPRPTVSVIIPARNEAGNIPAVLSRTPEMGAGTEIIFVEGHSTDGTAEAIRGEIDRHPERRGVLLRQTGRGKGDAVRLGFERASGDILMILDADLTVRPEDLPRFYDTLVRGRADVVNGVRMVYPMGRGAMRPLNLVGNKFFSLVFSWLLGQPIRDTLCGTKAMYAADYRAIAAGRGALGDFDPFGDFDLLFGAARLNLKIADMPVRYRDRVYGTTNISRFRHGWLLLRMAAFAARRIKFF